MSSPHLRPSVLLRYFLLAVIDPFSMVSCSIRPPGSVPFWFLKTVHDITTDLVKKSRKNFYHKAFRSPPLLFSVPWVLHAHEIMDAQLTYLTCQFIDRTGLTILFAFPPLSFPAAPAGTIRDVRNPARTV